MGFGINICENDVPKKIRFRLGIPTSALLFKFFEERCEIRTDFVSRGIGFLVGE